VLHAKILLLVVLLADLNVTKIHLHVHAQQVRLKLILNAKAVITTVKNVQKPKRNVPSAKTIESIHQHVTAQVDTTMMVSTQNVVLVQPFVKLVKMLIHV